MYESVDDPLPIEDYALIGDCRSAALVGRTGSMDWLCLPQFDSPACFAALLGSPANGRWQICPSIPVQRIRRRYRGNGLVLETEFETDQGSVSVIDFMPLPTQVSNVMRLVVGRKGTVPMRMEIILRFDYGSIVPWVRRIERGILAVAGRNTVRLRTGLHLKGEKLTTRADFVVTEGHRIPLAMTWYSSHHAAPPDLDVEQALVDTVGWWAEWSARCTYHGRYRKAVMRSLITLKALTFAPTGGIIAAPTTSLPERMGGVRNWDYRFCWVRDASFTLDALLVAGYTEEATAWLEWLLRAVAGKPSQLQIMYGISGDRRLTELQVAALPGYRGSRPVRVGNAAHEQFQLDIFGEVMEAAYLALQSGIKPEPHSWRVMRTLIQYLESVWHHADFGIWEVRGPQQHFTHSKVMAWLALDRAIKFADVFKLNGAIEEWTRIRDTIHQEVCERGFDSERGCFVQAYGSKNLDASLLRLPLVGFLPPDDPRMVATVEAIQRELMRGGLVRRYATDETEDGLPAGEGVFLACSFWMVDCLHLMGRREEARKLFEHLLELQNDVGLLPEEYDPGSKCFLGNFPQALSHVGLINSALNLTREPVASAPEAVPHQAPI